MKYTWEFKLECIDKYKNGEYIRFFDEERPSSAPGHLTPAQFKAKYAGKPEKPKKPSKIAYERKWQGLERQIRNRKSLLFVD